jgi:hypothetical protein
MNKNILFNKFVPRILLGASMQKVEEILVEDLILWSENPRDKFSSKSSSNVQIIEQALEDKSGKWELRKLASQMGDHYDFSELPTIVYNKSGIPIVYDGNRRVILAMLVLKIYPKFKNIAFKMPSCPKELPCCVTDEATAIDNIWRKHAETGSWDQISREIFQVRFRKQQKSVFLQLDEITNGTISQDKSLNQRFVADEVLTNPRLKSIGIKVENNKIISRHNEAETSQLLNEIFNLIKEKKITTRIDRTAQLSELVSEESKSIIEKDKDKEYQEVESSSVCMELKSAEDSQGTVPAPTKMPQIIESKSAEDSQGTVPASTKMPQIIESKSAEDSQGTLTGQTRLPQRIKSKDIPLFGEKFSLKTGEPANLYRDILDLYDFYIANKNKLSDRFPALIRMALRLECELIAKCANSVGMEKLVREDFSKAKELLSQNEKTYLAQNQVNENNIITLLQTGAHNYTGSYDLSQTLAMSLIVGGILKLHFGK